MTRYQRILLILDLSLCLTHIFGGEALTASEIFAKISPSIYTVKVGNGFGSGVVIGSETIITNCHVIHNGLEIKVSHKEIMLDAALLYANPKTDLCQLDVPNLEAPVVELGVLDEVTIGSPSFTIGSPKGLDLTISEGIVSSKRERDGHMVIQTTAAISKGSSGGGLFDNLGRLIGVTTFYVNEGQNLNFAMPADLIIELPETSVTSDKVSAKYYQRANFFKTAEKNESAEINAREWVKEYPKHWLGWQYLGQAQIALNKKREGLIALKEAFRINPKEHTIAFIIGLIYQSQAQYKIALHWYEKIDENVDRVNISLLKAACMIDSKQALKAIELLEKLASEYTSPRLNQLLGLGYSSVNKHKEAIYVLMDNTNDSKFGGEAWLRIGDSQKALGENFRALRSYKNSIGFNPEKAEAWEGLGKIAMELNDTEDIIKAHTKLLEFDAANPAALYGLGYGWYRRRDNKKSKHYLNLVVRMRPNHFEAWYLLGQIHAKEKSFDSSINAFNNAVKIDPDHHECMYKLGLAYGFTKQRDDLVKIYRKLKSAAPELAQKLKKRFRKRD